MKYCFLLLSALFSLTASAQSKKPTASNSPAQMVNVFLGSSGDHGQMSPAASYPFSMLSIGPQTYPNLHMGYEHKAKRFLGFTHNRFEGVGCQGSGGNILIKPFSGDVKQELIKAKETAGTGYYSVSFTNGIKADLAVEKNSGVEEYQFPANNINGFYIDLSHTLANRFVAEEHTVNANSITGWIDSRTTCNVGTYRVYYTIHFDELVNITTDGDHQLIVFTDKATQVHLRVGLSSVDIAHATAAINKGSYSQLKANSTAAWNNVLSTIKVQGDPERVKLFYSLLYRTVQSPYVVSETDGSYRATNGELKHTDRKVYNGWAIWDNYRTQLPLLSILYTDRYQDITTSIASLYANGKKDYATQHEPSNTVRTEHAMVVLLDAYRKGYKVDFDKIADSLIADAGRLDFSHPDKALESSYDVWALSQIMAATGKKELSANYLQKAADWKKYWDKDFKDIHKSDVDRMQARGLYQGTIWQYRWFVPFDLKGLMDATGGEKEYLSQLDYFFDNDLYNHANEPDIQVPLMYNMTSQPWKSQALMHKYAADTVVQYYFNDNSRGIDPFIDVIYRNAPDTYIRTMDDDAGAMSAWYVFSACGFSPACVGWPVYYLNVPLFKEVQIACANSKYFTVKVENFSNTRRYIQSATLNGKPLKRNWITQQDIVNGGTLVIKSGDTPVKNWGVKDQWVSDINMK